MHLALRQTREVKDLANVEGLMAKSIWASSPEANVIGSSDEEHVVDALAMIGDEGRESLRKASGSWQMSCDPKISEWGNPPKGIRV